MNTRQRAYFFKHPALSLINSILRFVHDFTDDLSRYSGEHIAHPTIFRFICQTDFFAEMFHHIIQIPIHQCFYLFIFIIASIIIHLQRLDTFLYSPYLRFLLKVFHFMQKNYFYHLLQYILQKFHFLKHHLPIFIP